MTPREIMYAILPALDREDLQKADRLVASALGVNDPKQAFEIIKDLT